MVDTGVIGWIGVGAMGLPICRSLLKSGRTVLVYDHLPERMDQAVAAGAVKMDSIRSLAQRSDLVFSMVYDDLNFREIVTGAGGLLEGSRPDSVFVDMSTVSPAVSEEMAELLSRQRVRYLRAPVSGSVTLAEAGELTVLVSGEQGVMEACLDVFKVFSRTQTYEGPGEAARIVKLVINTIVVGSTALIGEALMLGESAGLSRERLVDAINASIVGSRHYSSRAEALKYRRYGNSGPMRIVAKDMSLALNLEGTGSVKHPLLDFVNERVASLIEKGMGDVEVTVLAEPG